MEKSNTNHFIFSKIGLRNLKTAISASICAILYFIVDRNPTFCCIGAIFGMGNSMGDSYFHGGNRFFGTIIGGFLGMILYGLYLNFYPDGRPSILLVILLFIGIIILILLSKRFWVGAVQPGGVVLCIILFNTTPEAYVLYSINRMIDTGLGVAISLLINYCLPQKRIEHWIEKVKLSQRNTSNVSNEQ